MPIDGSVAALKLNPTPVTGGDVGEFVLSAAGNRVAYLANHEASSTGSSATSSGCWPC